MKTAQKQRQHLRNMLDFVLLSILLRDKRAGTDKLNGVVDRVQRLAVNCYKQDFLFELWLG